MIQGGTPFIVAAYAFAYTLLVGYAVALRRRTRRVAALQQAQWTEGAAGNGAGAATQAGATP